VPSEGTFDDYGYQYAKGSAGVSFNGQIALLVLRLPGQGTARVALRTDIASIGTVNLNFPAWDEASQDLHDLQLSAEAKNSSGDPDWAVVKHIPAQQTFTVSAALTGFG